MSQELEEKIALALYNRWMQKRHMRPVNYIGANNTPACNACREDARAALAVVREAMAEHIKTLGPLFVQTPDSLTIVDHEGFRAMLAASPLGEPAPTPEGGAK